MAARPRLLDAADDVNNPKMNPNRSPRRRRPNRAFPQNQADLDPHRQQAVADALSLLANIVMAWNTAKMQAIFDRWAQRRSGAVPPELIGRVAPTRTEGLNMRGVFSFPIEQYADQLLPSRVIPKMHLLGQ